MHCMWWDRVEMSADELFNYYDKEDDDSIADYIYCPDNAVNFMKEFLETPISLMERDERIHELEGRVLILESWQQRR